MPLVIPPTKTIEEIWQGRAQAYHDYTVESVNAAFRAYEEERDKKPRNHTAVFDAYLKYVQAVRSGGRSIDKGIKPQRRTRRRVKRGEWRGIPYPYPEDSYPLKNWR